jgi:hypothetical protein
MILAGCLISTVRESLKVKKNFQNQAKFFEFCNPEGVSGYPDRLRSLQIRKKGNQEQMATETRNLTKETIRSPVESPILFMDKSVSADTNRSP